MPYEDISFDVAPQNGRAKRLVIARRGEAELLRDVLEVASLTDRKRFLGALRDRLGLGFNYQSLEQNLIAAADAADAAAEAARAPEPEPPREPTPEELLAAMPEAVRAEARALLESPDLLRWIVADFAAVGVAGEKELAATLYLVGTSRMLDRPLAAIIQGPSSSGKSYVLECVARLFPPEAVLMASDLTPQALFYLPPGSLRHRWVVAGERRRAEEDEVAEATRALREMLSAGRLSKLVPVKEDGRIQTVLIEQEGPIAYSETTTLSRIFDEDANRCLLLNTDEQPQQTKRILDAAARAAEGQAPAAEAVIVRHHALQRILQRAAVVVPFARQLADRIDCRRVETRRAFPQLLGAIRASALLHQFQRTRDAAGRIIASRDDYELARYLLLPPLRRLLGGAASDGAVRFAQRLATWFGFQQTWTRQEAVKRDTHSERTIYGWVNELVRCGMAEVVDEGRGRTPSTYRLLSADTPDDALLPPPETITC